MLLTLHDFAVQNDLADVHFDVHEDQVSPESYPDLAPVSQAHSLCGIVRSYLEGIHDGCAGVLHPVAARAVGFTDRGEIREGLRADLIFVDRKMNVSKVILNGKVKY